jgi:uncharacterized repeat protein (TIGR01451 family)
MEVRAGAQGAAWTPKGAEMTTSHRFAATTLVLVAAACGGPVQSVGTTSDAISVSSPGPLAITLSSNASPVQGVIDTYTVTVTNNNPFAITSVSVGVDFQSASLRAVPAACVKLGGGTPLIDCFAASLDAGASLSFAFDIIPQTAGPVGYGASTCANGQTCNGVSDSETVAPGATDLQITGSSNQGSPVRNSQFTYTFQVKNDGPFATFGGVSFTDALPPALTFVSMTTSIGSCTGGASISCALGDLAVGGQATIQINVLAPSIAETVVNTASANLAPGQTDRNLANNNVSVTITSK